MNATDINVLIACEESQAECKAFRALGLNAFSCDIQKCAGNHPEWHIIGDVTPYLMGTTQFTTMDGVQHDVHHWHLIVAHPPCTYLCRVSASMHKRNNTWLPGYYDLMIQAREFFFTCLNASADYVVVENPIPLREACLPKPAFYTCPSWFGYKYTKRTLWWTTSLPPVMPQLFHPFPKCYVTCSRGKYRSRTFPRVAEACAQTWGTFVMDHLYKLKEL